MKLYEEHHLHLCHHEQPILTNSSAKEVSSWRLCVQNIVTAAYFFPGMAARFLSWLDTALPLRCTRVSSFLFVLSHLHARPTPAAAIRNVKWGDTATTLTKDHQPAWGVEGKRNVAIETACAALEPAAIMVPTLIKCSQPLSLERQVSCEMVWLFLLRLWK